MSDPLAMPSPLGQFIAWSAALGELGFAHQLEAANPETPGSVERVVFYRAKKGHVEVLTLPLADVASASPKVQAYTQSKDGTTIGTKADFCNRDLTSSLSAALAHVGSPLRTKEQRVLARVGRLLSKAWTRITGAIQAAALPPKAVAKAILARKEEHQNSRAVKRARADGWQPSDRADLRRPGAETLVRVEKGVEQVLHVWPQDPEGPNGGKFAAALSTHYHRGTGVLTNTVEVAGRSTLAAVLRASRRAAERDLDAAATAQEYKRNLTKFLAHSVVNPLALGLHVSPVAGPTTELTVAIHEDGKVLRTLQVLEGPQFEYLQKLVKEQFALSRDLPVSRGAQGRAPSEFKAQVAKMAKAGVSVAESVLAGVKAAAPAPAYAFSESSVRASLSKDFKAPRAESFDKGR